MKKKVEVQIDNHYPGGNMCDGSGVWTRRQIDQKKRIKNGQLGDCYSAECPNCRKVIPCFNFREIPSVGTQIKEFFSRRVSA